MRGEGGGGEGGGIEEAPLDGNYYDAKMAAGSQNALSIRVDYVKLSTAAALLVLPLPLINILDGGNFTTGVSGSTATGVLDGGNFATGASGSTYRGKAY